jgi:hypothetical protein
VRPQGAPNHSEPNLRFGEDRHSESNLRFGEDDRFGED